VDKIIIGTLSLLVVIAIGTIVTNFIRKAIILSGVLSILASFLYILLLAPDVALAEAVIGCTLSTVILLMAIQYLEVVQIVYTTSEISYNDLAKIFSDIYSIEKYEINFTSNKENPNINLHRYHHLDYFVFEMEEKVVVLSRREDGKNQKILKAIQKVTDKPVRLVNETWIYEK